MNRGFQSIVSIFTLLSLMFSFMAAGGGIVSAGSSTSTETRVPAVESSSPAHYGEMSLLFEENSGQTDANVKFVSRGPGYTLYLSNDEASFSLKRPNASDVTNDSLRDKRDRAKNKIATDSLIMRFVGANSNPTVAGRDERLTKTNYYIGKKKIENVTNYDAVTYKGLYEGIDAVFYGNDANQLEYDFEVAPDAIADQIRLSFAGARSITIDERGNLVVATENTQLVQKAPVAFQMIGAERREVEASYVINENEVTFALGAYDKSQPLTIDPALDYLTYIGGTAFDNVFEIAADAQGNAYITGDTESLDFHGEARSSRDGQAVYAAKINADGTQFVYITILEGTGDDVAFGLAVDASTNVYLAGVASRNFPTTAGAYDTVHGVLNEDDAFVAKLNASGNIAYASYIGGTDQDRALDVAIDSSGKAYVVGETFSSTAFPTKNRFQGCGVFFPTSTNSLDAFLTVFNAAGSDITYSTCIGVGGFQSAGFEDSAFSVAVDGSNNAYVTGFTGGNGSFPTKNAAQPTEGGGVDAWVTKFNPGLSGDDSVVYSTYLGGSGTDKGFAIAVTSTGTASVTGITGSANFPLLNAFDSTNQVNEAFVSQYNSAGSKLNATFLGGADQDQGNSIAVGNGGTIYVAGETLSNNFPLATPFQSTRRGVRDAFVTKVRFGANNNPGVSSSSYLGGNGNDNANGIAVVGNFIYLSGQTASNNLSTTSGVIKATSTADATNADGFVAKILDSRKDTIGAFDPINTIFDLRNTLTAGAPDITVDRGIVGDVAVAGDFNGDGVDTVSTFNNGTWKIQNLNVIAGGYSTGGQTVSFGQAGDLPVVGDWNNDGFDTVGVYRPSTGQFFLTNSQTNVAAPPINQTQTFGIAEDLPIAGDWNGDGKDTIGVFRPSAGQFFLTNDPDNQFPAIDLVAFFGTNGDLPVGGDWDGDGKDSIGVWRPSTLEFFLSNDNGSISNQFIFGSAGDRPVVGDWDGKPNQ